ncbi:MAG: hypothetical protein KC486_36500 [Myxococcales bacterium]|nr:hypothetical protein [Myxococcales bacterium]
MSPSTTPRRPPSASARAAQPWLALALSLSGPACDAPTRALPRPDPEVFAESVYPTLLRDCAFAGCHGDPRRPLFIPGPGRVRLDPESTPLDPATAAEIGLAYDRARGLAEREVGDAAPLLVEKTLAGSAHGGRDRHGVNVYEDDAAPGLAALEAWLADAAGGDEP